MEFWRFITSDALLGTPVPGDYNPVLVVLSGGAAALHDAVRDGRPYRLVVLDHCMPDMDGLSLGRRVRDDDGIPPAGLLLAGMDRFVSKPVAAGALVAAIKALVRDMDLALAG